MTETSPTLLQRLRTTGDPAAWERFVELYAPVLLRWARGLRLQESDAADLTQEVFAIVLKEMPAFAYDRQKSFRAWLKTVALNHWRATCRRRRPAHALPEADSLAAGTDDDQFWEVEYRHALAAQALALMKAEFHETTWRACWLVVAEGQSAAQAAALTGLTPGAVRVAKSRVLVRLRQELGDLLE